MTKEEIIGELDELYEEYMDLLQINGDDTGALEETYKEQQKEIYEEYFRG